MEEVPDIDVVALTPRSQTEARRVAREAYPFRCCVVCGLQIETCLTLAHLDHNGGHNDADNLAYRAQKTSSWKRDTYSNRIPLSRRLSLARPG
jgi:hypothetical protein